MTTIFKPWTVVEVPFPFIDKAIAKKRKALVVCTQSYSVAGLKKPCVVRLKVFTLESSLVIGEVGHLYAGDIKHVKEALAGAIPT